MGNICCAAKDKTVVVENMVATYIMSDNLKKIYIKYEFYDNGIYYKRNIKNVIIERNITPEKIRDGINKITTLSLNDTYADGAGPGVLYYTLEIAGRTINLGSLDSHQIPRDVFDTLNEINCSL